MRKLTLADILDAREYERHRAEMRAKVIDLKTRRRVAIGTIITITFENRETMQYQIQEMARVERIITDDGIQEELDAYNPLIPEPGELCATLFVELSSDDQMREWLPRLVGLENSVRIVLPALSGPEGTVRGVVRAEHAAQLTRDEVTAAVHYLTFQFSSAQVAAFTDGTVLEIDHPAYREAAELSAATVAELRRDLLPTA